MLVLSRKSNESVQIGEDIVIKILNIRPGRVRIGIEAPLDVRIRREETLFDVVFPPELELTLEEFPTANEMEQTSVPATAC